MNRAPLKSGEGRALSDQRRPSEIRAHGRLAEIFLDAAKESPLVELAQESAIVASLAMQSGCPLEVLRHALAGRGAGPLGAALALIEDPAT